MSIYFKDYPTVRLSQLIFVFNEKFESKIEYVIRVNT